MSFDFIACPPLFSCVLNPSFRLTPHCPSSQTFTLVHPWPARLPLVSPLVALATLGPRLELLCGLCPVRPSILVFPEQNSFHARHGPVPPALSLGRRLSFPCCCPSDCMRISIAVVEVEARKHPSRQAWGSPRSPSWGSARWESWWPPWRSEQTSPALCCQQGVPALLHVSTRALGPVRARVLGVRVECRGILLVCRRPRFPWHTLGARVSSTHSCL